MKKNLIPLIVAVILLLGTVYFSMGIKSNNISNIPDAKAVNNISFTPKKPVVVNTKDQKEMRAVWVPCLELDMNESERTYEEFRRKFDSIIKTAKDHNLNTVIVHVRSHGDAMYPSKYFPWSHLITGTQGKDPGFDPLKYMVESTHKAGLSFHAWVNPLRIRANDVPKQLCSNNPYNSWRNDQDKTNDDWVLDFGQDKYYNPAYPEVRKLITKGVGEIVKNYDVDGIHFDDYFYPTEDPSYDKDSYDKYCKSVSDHGTALTQSEWRVANINSIISGVYSEIKSIKSNVVFGIAPQGVVKTDDKMSADVRTWGKVKGYVDYLCPQIYVNLENKQLPFEQTVNEWRKIVSCPDVKFYVGVGIYKAGSEDIDEGTWKKSNDILKREIEHIRNSGADGFMLYSCVYLDHPQTKEEISNVMRILN